MCRALAAILFTLVEIQYFLNLNDEHLLIMFRTKAIFYITFSLLAITSLGQTKVKKINTGGFEFQVSALNPADNDAFCEVGEMPEFPGGMSKLVDFAKRKMKYPKSAINDDVQGTVILQFTITKSGRLISKKILKGVRHDLNSVCLNMLNQMPIWNPGKLNGKTISTSLKWSIKFVLTP
jgi:protein TonB